MEIDRIYEDYIADLASKKINRKFLNTNSSHAVTVLSNLFRFANRTVNIYCQNLCGEISKHEQYIDAVRRFLAKPDAKLQILLFQHWAELETQPIWSVLEPALNKQVFIRYQNDGSEAASGHIQYDAKDVNFAVADGVAYRFETDIEKHSAYGNFNDPAQAGVLEAVFADFYARGTAI